MKRNRRPRYAADMLTLLILALLAVAAIWLFMDQVTGRHGVVSQMLFGFAIGLFLGNALRLSVGLPNRPHTAEPPPST